MREEGGSSKFHLSLIKLFIDFDLPFHPRNLKILGKSNLFIPYSGGRTNLTLYLIKCTSKRAMFPKLYYNKSIIIKM